ncbi:MAG: DnaJ domain-containing protein [Salinibacter sp.]
MIDCYAVLEVGRDASQEEIKDAYRKRVLECHPDRAADGEEAAAKEEFLRVRRAFELLSDPQKRAAYDAPDEEGTTDGETDETSGRRRSYEDAWRQSRGETVTVSRTILSDVRGLSADYKIIEGRTSYTVPVCSLMGVSVFLYEPSAIYATEIFFVDLMLCTALGGIYGLIIGYAWGYADLFVQRAKDRS